MKKIVMMLFAAICMSATAAHAPKGGSSPQEIYIGQFATLAVEEMYRSGIPASITLAQGLLESRYGLSELAVKGNNHFGIKCHNNWKGGRMYYDDDRRGECFRKYPSPEQSYRDHSDFLRYRDRYKFLFDYKVTDYKAWAYGLKKAGYATDPAYPKKLISIIEEYDLHEYDRKPASFARSDRKAKASSQNKAMTKEEKRAAKAAAKAAREVAGNLSEELPQSPTMIEEVRPLTEVQRQDFHFNMSREVYSQNGVAFVYASEGDTYRSLAATYNLFPREILKFNDVKDADAPVPGTKVYLRAKKKQTSKGLEKHVMEEGETMRDIAQRYGVKLSNLYKMNGMSEGDVPREGDIIKLRK